MLGFLKKKSKSLLYKGTQKHRKNGKKLLKIVFFSHDDLGYIGDW